MKFLRTFFRGFDYHREYGYHDGHAVMIFLLVMGGLAGGSRGSWQGALFGMGVFGLVYGIPYLISVYFHGRDILRDEEKGDNNEEVKFSS